MNKGCTGDEKNVEIIFVSCDTTKEEFNEHFAELPFPGLMYGSPAIEKLEELFDVESIPVVPLLSKNGYVVYENVRRMITEKGADCFSELLAKCPS